MSEHAQYAETRYCYDGNIRVANLYYRAISVKKIDISRWYFK